MTVADGGGFFRLHRADQVATITVASAAAWEEPRRRGGSVHWEFAALLGRLRTDNSVRVIVITGAGDGEFWVPPPLSVHSAAHSRTTGAVADVHRDHPDPAGPGRDREAGHSPAYRPRIS